MDLPNEIWMKILSFLPTHDILKNFNLTCKHFYSLATNPCAIKCLNLKLENAKDSSQYQKIVKVLQRSKTLNKLIIEGQGRNMNHILAHGLKSNHLKTLQVLSHIEATMTKKNLEYIKKSNIESLKLEEVILDNYAMKQIGALKTLKSVRILLSFGSRQMTSISELIKTFIEAKIELEDLAIVARRDLELYPSVFSKFLEERGETLKKLNIRCTLDDSTWKNERKRVTFSTKWNATSNLEELYYDDHGSQNGRSFPIEFGAEMPKLTKLVLRNINGNILLNFGTQKFPVLERLYLDIRFGDENLTRKTIFNILKNCPGLKSVKLLGLNLSEPEARYTWCAFLCKMYKDFNVYIDIFNYQNWSINFSTEVFEKYLKKTCLATFNKYTNIKTNYLDWEKNDEYFGW